MSQPTDVEALAKEFLDLWQQQAAATLTDPGLSDAMARWLELAGGFFAAAQGIKPSAPAGAADDGLKARAASSGAAPGGGQHGLDDLLRRLAACEKRLARLEKQPKGGQRRASPRARRRSG
jgi:hypothetical protein